MPSNVPGSSQDRPRNVPDRPRDLQDAKVEAPSMPNDTHRHHKPKKLLQNCHKYAYTTLRNLARTVEKMGSPATPCIIASHFTMCVLVWVFERGSLATPFLPSKMKCLFHTAGEILGAPYESVGTPHLRVGGIGRQASTIKKNL